MQADTSRHRPASTCTSKGDGTQTRNLRIDSPLLTCCNPLPEILVTSIGQARCSAGRSDDANDESEGGEDPDLSRLVAAWPTLSEPIRRAMLAILEAAM